MSSSRRPTRDFWKEYGRALAGALIFAYPLLMTMEMWWLGMYLDRARLALFISVFVPILILLSRYSGFRKTFSWFEDIVDAFVALTAGLLIAAIFLYIFGILDADMSQNEIIGKLAILTVPGSLGAIIASKNLGSKDRNPEDEIHSSYQGELFIMVAGAIFLAFNVAPTEEVTLIAFKMNFGDSVILMLLSLLIMYALVYSLDFRGQHPAGDRYMLILSLNFTVTGYALALLVSAYVLWTFGRFDDMGLDQIITTTVVLGFPAGLGASTARLII
jgi:putative integral membrane protein (TIGR02587 family)